MKAAKIILCHKTKKFLLMVTFHQQELHTNALLKNTRKSSSSMCSALLDAHQYYLMHTMYPQKQHHPMSINSASLSSENKNSDQIITSQV